jgi:bla regulator protein BlaR1
MTTWLDFGASNALSATVLAVFAWLVSRAGARPQVVFALWVLVLAKLVTPPLVALPVENLREYLSWSTVVASHEPTDLPVGELLQSDALPSHLLMPSEPLASTAVANPMETPHGALEFEEITPLDESDSATPFDEAEFRLAELDRVGEVAAAAAEPFALTHLLVVAWLVGSALWFGVAAARIMRFRRLLKLARPAPPDLEAEVRTLAGRMQLRHVPEVRVVRRRVSPLVWALRRLTRDERTTLLAHELAHLKRGDHLVRLLELAALGLFWWHPVAWWARRNAECAAEHCCDAQVIELFPAQARAYALALWSTIDFLSDAPEALPLGASGFSHAGHVKRRMEMILANTHARRAGRPLGMFLLAIGLAVLPLSLRSLWAEPAAPSEAQQAHEETILGATADATEESSPETAAIEERQSESIEDVSDLVADVETVEGPRPDAAKLQAIAFLVDAQAVEPPSDKPAPKTPNIEERLDRLEKMIQALAERRPGPEATPDEKLGIDTTVKWQDKAEKPRPEEAATKAAKSLDEELSSKLTKEDTSDLGVDAEHRLVEIVRHATMHLELSKTNYNRYEAARRQAAAVRKAYEADTVRLDQLLEAQRRVVEAYSSFVNSAAALEPKALERQLIIAKARFAASNRALNEARETWKNVHQGATPGSGEEKGEAQAREQYYEMKQQAQILLKEYKLAEAAMKNRAPNWNWGGEAKARTEKSGIEARYKYAAEKTAKQATAKLKAAADEMKNRMADAEKVQLRAKLEIEKARREAEEARWKLEGLEKHAKLREQEAATAAKTAEAAAKNLELLKAGKAAEDAAKEAPKTEEPKSRY